MKGIIKSNYKSGFQRTRFEDLKNFHRDRIQKRRKEEKMDSRECVIRERKRFWTSGLTTNAVKSVGYAWGFVQTSKERKNIVLYLIIYSFVNEVVAIYSQKVMYKHLSWPLRSHSIGQVMVVIKWVGPYDIHLCFTTLQVMILLKWVAPHGIHFSFTTLPQMSM